MTAFFFPQWKGITFVIREQIHIKKIMAYRMLSKTYKQKKKFTRYVRKNVTQILDKRMDF
jgi:hypothetical protein